MQNVTLIGIDLGKHSFHIHCQDQFGKTMLCKKFTRTKLMEFLAGCTSTTVVMEACAGAHFMARRIADLGHEWLKIKLSPFLISLIGEQYYRLSELDKEIERLEKQLTEWANQNADCQRIMKIPGVGVLIATAAIATMGDPTAFRSGREFSAYLGLVPRHTGTGGRVKLLGISKRGDTYLRTLFIHGARVATLCTKTPPQWVSKLRKRRPVSVAIVGMANKLARTVWARIAHQREYEKDDVSVRLY
ncbi:IS110 family transposase [Xenorhabdus sp. Vera]|uniref:IS110 family transposase n=1 Tax=Xenorhabdus koppenhoeferi TaxID=351659 RepID=UPI0019C0E826|nr:IS110 family transposase [Xenorhabdus sp. Vera]MBD2812603.1 IS110 family transposase [Xenorhabdus sp. Vera]